MKCANILVKDPVICELNLWTVPVLSLWAGCRAERPSPHSQDTCAGVLTVQSLPVLCPSLWNRKRERVQERLQTGEVQKNKKKRREPEEGGSINIIKITLLQCLFCKCCIPRLFVREGSVLSTEVVFYSLNTRHDILALDAIITPLLFFLSSQTLALCLWTLIV